MLMYIRGVFKPTFMDLNMNEYVILNVLKDSETGELVLWSPVDWEVWKPDKKTSKMLENGQLKPGDIHMYKIIDENKKIAQVTNIDPEKDVAFFRFDVNWCTYKFKYTLYDWSKTDRYFKKYYESPEYDVELPCDRVAENIRRFIYKYNNIPIVNEPYRRCCL